MQTDILPIIRRIEAFALLIGLAAIVFLKLGGFSNSELIGYADDPAIGTDYDFVFGFSIPLILGFATGYSAWALFHFYLFPKLTKLTLDGRSWTILILIAILIGCCAYFLSLTYNKNYAYSHIGNSNILTITNGFRKRYLPADALVIFSMILLFEVWSQTLYRAVRKYPNTISNGKLLFGLALIYGLIPLGHSLFPGIIFHIAPVQFWTLIMFGCWMFAMYIFFKKYLIDIFKKNHVEPVVFQYALLYVVFAILGTFIVYIMLTRTGTRFQYSPNPYPPGFGISIALLLLVVPIPLANWTSKVQIEKTQLETQVTATSAELSQLRTQINPHFLFNALNSLYATALKENSEKTANGIQILGDMMRFLLHENHLERIPFSKEIEYLHNYIYLQRMRIDESYGIEIRTNIQEISRDFLIAPMILIPFIENAFKHGVSLRNKSWIFITLTFDDSSVYFKVHNSAHPAIANDPEKDKSGIGLENVKKRLNLIYPDRHELSIQASEQDFFISLKLQILSPVTNQP